MSSLVLLIDNYDSFVYNLARYIEELGASTHVVRNDAISIEEIQNLAPRGIVLSPGPCSPSEAGICMDVVRQFGPDVPILGVCLGHQAIAAALGGAVVRAREPVHGRTSIVQHIETGLFHGCPQPMRVTRYHSLIVDEGTLPPSLQVTARLPDRTIMGISHREWPVHGVQFHPESILTQSGPRLLANFLQLAGYTCDSWESLGDLIDSAEQTDDFYRRSIDPWTHPPA